MMRREINNECIYCMNVFWCIKYYEVATVVGSVSKHKFQALRC